MRVFGYGIKGFGAAVLLSGITAGLVVSLTSSSAANRASGGAISVNRINKGDRLPQASPVRQPSNSAYQYLRTAAIKTPAVGCDPSFSPAA